MNSLEEKKQFYKIWIDNHVKGNTIFKEMQNNKVDLERNFNAGMRK